MSQSKKRPCPVLGKTISSSDCAENRGPDFGCPGDCEFNPWGDAAFPEPFLDTEAKLKQWAFERLEASLGRNWQARRADAYKATPYEDFCEMIHAIHVGDGSRPSPLGRWLAERPKELRRDERILGGFQDQAMPMLLEVHQVVDETGIECVDLLEPERPPFILRNSDMAMRVCRFQLLFGWAYHTPWFTRALGLLTPMDWQTARAPEEIIAILARSRGWSPEAASLRDWLRQNVAAMGQSLQAWHDLNRQALLQNQPLIQSCIEYKPREEPGKIAIVLRRAMNVITTETTPGHRADGFSIVLNVVGDYDKSVGGRLVYGMLLLGKNRAQFEGYQCPEFDAAAARLEKTAGAALKRVQRNELDLGARMLEREPEVSGREFVPEELIDREASPRIQTYIYEDTPDEPLAMVAGPTPADFVNLEVAALDGLSPLAAASRPDLRPRLVNLVKSHIHSDDRQRSKGHTDDTTDFGPMLRELGLGELDFPPPPLEESMNDLLLSEDDADGDYEDDYDAYTDYTPGSYAVDNPALMAELAGIRGIDSAGLPPVPPRPAIDLPMARRLYDGTVNRFKDPGDLVTLVIDQWEDMFERVAGPLAASGAGEESPEFASFVIHFGIMAHMLFPKRGKPLPYDEIRLARATQGYSMEILSRLDQSRDDDYAGVLLDVATLSPEPAVAEVILSRCLTMWYGQPGAKGTPQLDPVVLPIVAAGLLGALWEMNYLRRQ